MKNDSNLNCKCIYDTDYQIFKAEGYKTSLLSNGGEPEIFKYCPYCSNYRLFKTGCYNKSFLSNGGESELF